MRARVKSIALVVLLLLSAMFAAACTRKVQDLMDSRRNGVPFEVPVMLPRDMKNAETDSAVLKESAVVVSVPADEYFYVGRGQYPLESVGEKISALLQSQPAAGRIVYVGGGEAVDYKYVLRIIAIARKEGVNTIGLLVERLPGKDAPNLFKVQIPAEPDLDDVLPPHPDPLALLVSVGTDSKVKLNEKPIGDTSDATNLAQMLTQVLQQRQENEKTVTIKAPHSTTYGHVVRLIDAARGAGASPIVLQIDDLPL